MEFIVHASSSTGNLYELQSDNDRSLLIEAGLPIATIRQKMNFRLSSTDACLITHAHADHAKAAKDLMKAGIDAYCSAETAEAQGLSGHRLHIVEAGKQFEIGGTWRIVPFDGVHDSPCFGFLVSDGADKLLFAVDTAYIHNRFQGLTMIAIEANYGKEYLSPDLNPVVRQRLYRNHLSLETAKDFLKAQDFSQVREIHLLHCSASNSNTEVFKHEIQSLTGKPVYVAKE